jgi:hypothetical protein
LESPEAVLAPGVFSRRCDKLTLQVFQFGLQLPPCPGRHTGKRKTVLLSICCMRQHMVN